jgi:hypothetical protein
VTGEIGEDRRRRADLRAAFGSRAQVTHTSDSGLRGTFLVSLVALVASGAVALLVGRRTYPQDAAALSMRRPETGRRDLAEG